MDNTNTPTPDMTSADAAPNTEHAPRMAPTMGCRFVARVAFDHGAIHYEPGQEFDLGSIGMNYDQALIYWNSALINVADANADLPPPPVTPPTPAEMIGKDDRKPVPRARPQSASTAPVSVTVQPASGQSVVVQDQNGQPAVSSDGSAQPSGRRSATIPPRK